MSRRTGPLGRLVARVTSLPLRPKLFISHCLVALGTMVVFVLMTYLVNPQFALFLRQGGSLAAVVPYVLLAGLVSGLIAMAGSLFVASRITRPVTDMLSATRLISAGDYSERVPKQEDDELGRLSQSFNEMAEALEAAEYQRSEFISDTSHELKTPITTLQGYLEGLIDGVIEPSDDTWGLMYVEAERMRRLVDDLRQLSRAESETLTLHLESLDPVELADLASDGMRPLFTEKGVCLDAEHDPDLPPVRADRDRTLQVLANLLSNALRYTPKSGRVTVCVRSETPGSVAFQVSDSGAGVRPEDLPRLFDRFYRTEKSRSREGGGAGIGLAISRALVEAMGGRIRAESPGPGRGATFTFTLPTSG
ncbi:Signal transduction histidine kinase [Rubrobacter radiotolerans]|uniref:histidine kinase n=1 Tax=Rubrobacter radiotolerans TaxID=42256 RepID=A0A023X3R1_RUBRA|nr:HAMP domain-containing sensor histidine kinase [Rubrobacter radiotolerans]AHY46635.1 Signal transduction histidine kinase [Rubrobacter radiotolerans]MDX5894042.1 HAMP domain-containing sensor histidine kinase [Rubrobacter radiotolerans]SMC05046.1 His Kinase A (phospho-acceptor) domain-containing protein [Rubrobacter radiotolerans DSM 5868]